MNSLAKARHLNELVKNNSGAKTNEHFDTLIKDLGEEKALGAMMFAYWNSCKISNIRPLNIEWMKEFYSEMEAQEKAESEYGI